MGNVAGRNGAERKEWSVSEDNIIRESVMAHGCRWRRIAAQLPGRSDDAVRNRWNRLKEMGITESATPSPPAPAPAPAAASASAVDGADAAAPAAAPSAGSSDPPSPPDGDAVLLPLPEGMVVDGEASGGAPPARAPLKPHAAGGGKGGGEGNKPERVSWSKAEDDTILRGVAELGHKWNRIAERLPGRTDHAIRNRFHRLQSLLEDRQRQQQRVLAPNMPLPVPMAVPVQLPGGDSLMTTAAEMHSLLTRTPGTYSNESASGGSASGGSGFETPVGSSTSPQGGKVVIA